MTLPPHNKKETETLNIGLRLNLLFTRSRIDAGMAACSPPRRNEQLFKKCKT